MPIHYYFYHKKWYMFKKFNRQVVFPTMNSVVSCGAPFQNDQQHLSIFNHLFVFLVFGPLRVSSLKPNLTCLIRTCLRWAGSHYPYVDSTRLLYVDMRVVINSTSSVNH